MHAVLRKAAVSGEPGCAHTAASCLRRIGESADGQDEFGREWMRPGLPELPVTW